MTVGNKSASTTTGSDTGGAGGGVCSNFACVGVVKGGFAVGVVDVGAGAAGFAAGSSMYPGMTSRNAVGFGVETKAVPFAPAVAGRVVCGAVGIASVRVAASSVGDVRA
jgi:hypothetical protein